MPPKVLGEDSTVNYGMHLVEGDPRDATLRLVEQVHADLVVVGSRGSGLIARAMLGSVSTWLATHSSVPVLIVRH